MDVEIMSDMQHISEAILGEAEFQNIDIKVRLQFIGRKLEEIQNFISQHLHRYGLFLHHHKIEALEEAFRKILHTRRTVHFYEKHSNAQSNGYPDLSKIKGLFDEISESFFKYAEFGSVYLVRHCEKAKRNKILSGEEYDGIPTHAIKIQAMGVASDIYDEILLSPKKVRLIVRNSEADRTRIFGEIVIRKAKMANQVHPGKVVIDGPSEDSRIGFHFTKDALAELNDVFEKKGEYYSFINWLMHRNEFSVMKKQPDPREVATHVQSFLLESHSRTKNQEFYTIVIGFSHSWVIDAALFVYFPHLESQIDYVIKTASYCKAECGELSYLGEWTRL